MSLKVKKNLKPTVIDLFSGCGGLSFGMQKAGFEVLLGIDNWSDALETFAKNHTGAKIFLADLAKIKPAQVSEKFGIKKGDVDVVIGGPPCQGFSISGKRDPGDPRNGLYKAFVDFVGYFQPKAFLMENVPNLVSMDNGRIKDKIIQDFSRCGYKVGYSILKASDFGVPQNRRRVFFVGLKNGGVFNFPIGDFGSKLNPYVTTKEAINDLPRNSVSDSSAYSTPPLSNFQKFARSGSAGIYNHETIEHKKDTERIIAMVPDGGNYKDLPKELQSTRKVNIAWTRLNSKKPSFTIDTGHNHIFHYKFNRVPTAREAARIQSFPDKFIFWGKNKASHLKQVGNAVPPLIGEILGKRLLRYL